MAGVIAENGVFVAETNLPLMADVQYLEPFGSAAFNRKTAGILHPGVYQGFDCTPAATGVAVTVSSKSVTQGAACIDIAGGYQITVQQFADVTVTVPAGKASLVVLEANYGQGKLTKQVTNTATLDAARILVKDLTAGLESNQIELCRVNVPLNAKAVTAQMIDVTKRIRRYVGPIVSDRIDSSSQIDVASSNAVKLALEAAKLESDKKIARGESGLMSSALNLVSNFNWQTYVFKGGEYLYIDWATATNKPDIDYPDGYYQIMVIGLNDGTNQTLLIRPTNYTQPLAPFMISWTGAAGSRVFKTRALVTSFADINALGGIGPNDLTRVCHTGTFGQLGSAAAVPEKGYPFPEAGSLSVTPSAYGVQQEYTGFSSGRRAVRGRVAQQDGSYIWGGWNEYPTINHDGLWQPDKKLGVAGFEQNSVYFDNRKRTVDNIVAGVRSEWYTHNTYAGIKRDNGDNTLGYSIEVDNSEVARFHATSSNLNTGSFTTYFNANSSASMAPNAIRINATGTKHLWFNDATGVEVGIIYATDDKTIHMRAAQGPDFAVDYQGNAILTGGGVMTVPSLHAVSGVYIGDGDSGFHESGDGRVAIHINSANQGYFKSGSMYYPQVRAGGLVVGGGSDFAAETAAVFSIGSDQDANRAKNNSQLHLWGSGTRETVLEFSDSEGYYFYTQRNADKSILFSINGSLAVGSNSTFNGQVLFNNQIAGFPFTIAGGSPSLVLHETDANLKTFLVADGTSWRFHDENTSGVTALAWDKTDKVLKTDGIFRSGGGIAAGGNSGISGDLTVAGKIMINHAAPIIQFSETDTSKSIFFIMDGGNCRLQEDSAIGREIFTWSRQATTLSTVGSFSAAGEIHTAQRITILDTDSGLRGVADGVVAFQANGTDIGYFSSGGIGLNSGHSYVIEAREQNMMRVTNEMFNTNGQVMVGGIVSNWYNGWLAFGCQRGGSTDIAGFNVWCNGVSIFQAGTNGVLTTSTGTIASQTWVGGNYCTIAQRDGINAVLATIVKDIRLNGRVGMSADGWSAAPDGAVVNGGGDFGSANGSYSYTWVQKYTDATGWVTVQQV